MTNKNKQDDDIVSVILKLAFTINPNVKKTHRTVYIDGIYYMQTDNGDLLAISNYDNTEQK